MHVLNAAGVYLLKVNYEYERRNCGICSKLTVKTPEQSQLTPLRYLLVLIKFRSSHLRCYIKKAVLKNFAIFTWKHVCWSLFLIKLPDFRPATSLERDSNTGVFLWILQNFQEHLFWKTSTCGCFYKLQKFLQSYRKPNWNEVSVKVKIYCLLWTDFTMCPTVFIVDFEQVSSGWEAKSVEKK